MSERYVSLSEKKTKKNKKNKQSHWLDKKKKKSTGHVIKKYHLKPTAFEVVFSATFQVQNEHLRYFTTDCLAGESNATDKDLSHDSFTASNPHTHRVW